MRLNYTLTPRTRVSAGRRGIVQNTRPVYDVIPGTVVRGALGTAWWSSPTHAYTGPDPRAAFERLFVGGMCVWAAVPTLGQHTAELRGLSWTTCKYPGDSCSRHWHDTAVDVLGRLTPQDRRCPACDGPMRQGRGWALPDLEDGRQWMASVTRTMLEGGEAKDENLFTRQSLVKEVTLHGSISLTDNVPDSAVDWLTTDKDVSLGGQRSTLGRCRWQSEVATDSAPPETNEVVLRLRSPAILLDGYGAPTLDLKGAIERRTGQVRPPTVARVWTRPVVVSGWHGVAGLPKPEEWALDAGSTAAIRDLTSSGIHALMSGLGIRRNEGYGEVDVLTAEQAAAVTGESNSRGEQEPRNYDDPPTSREVLDDNMAKFIRSLLPERRIPVLRGLLTLTRSVQVRAEGGASRSEIESIVTDHWTYSWARDLSGAQRDNVIVMMAAPPAVLSELITKLTRVTGGA